MSDVTAAPVDFYPPGLPPMDVPNKFKDQLQLNEIAQLNQQNQRINQLANQMRQVNINGPLFKARWLMDGDHIPHTQPFEEETMLEQLLRLYTVAMATGVTSPMPHFVGPPGSGKSTVFYQLAELLGVNLHIVNVSRLSPLGLEGLEMPDQKNESLRLLISELWTKLEDADIVVFDEFLRGFPEVYNGLLDIFTSREVAGFKLKRVFIAGASNSTVAYDKALEDRLLHLKVPDPRRKPTEKRRLAQMLVDKLGLHPSMAESYDMERLLDNEVLPTFEILDHFDGRASRNGSASIKGSSMRKLIGQAQLRQVESLYLKELIQSNNHLAAQPGKAQYMFLLSGKNVPNGYEQAAKSIKGSSKLTELQALNLELNLQLIELERAKIKSPEGQEGNEDDDDLFADLGS